ncbi:hypothetical protein V6N13_025554 [Hibiscus sabdariffa]
MGLLNEADDEVCEMVPCDNDNISWAESVDRAMNAKFGWNAVIARDTVLELGSMNIFPELNGSRNKKYGLFMIYKISKWCILDSMVVLCAVSGGLRLGVYMRIIGAKGVGVSCNAVRVD